MPALCRKMGVPYVIVKSKARLGKVVHHKTATSLAIVDVDATDAHEFSQLCQLCNETFNSRGNEIRKKWGGQTLGPKARHARAAEKAAAKLAAKQ